ncbi:MerR family transcriptional regulator [Gluconobacter cerinus]|uniref:Cd(II)/Pb(II)-responsive transcriptional regulator n=1 Tax=Gluconobacter cerinus TaxID=38307 RepID=A0AAV5NID5_9PROT|nr:helix-turn-helix domain-containing protein [Gluconobacter cerinus]GLQ63919.1 Cd(II)/Pb(II)-responsive transcriptional regulator [Gluconobacter cerinus]
MTQTFSIGELGRRTDTKVETIRYYERSGLLPAPPRSSGNYRVYSQDHLTHLSFIRRARELGFSIEQIRILLDLAKNTNQSCACVDSITRDHLEDIEHKIRDLQSLHHELSQLLAQCQKGKIDDCRILETLGPKLPLNHSS